MILLAPSANTSFGGLPVLLKLLARDNYLPHVFALKADRRVHRHGALALALVSAALLVFSGGDTNTLVPLFAIGVFVGFTIAQVGMVRHWRAERGPRRQGKALLNGSGFRPARDAPVRDASKAHGLSYGRRQRRPNPARNELSSISSAHFLTSYLGACDGRRGLRHHHDRGVRAGGSRRQGGDEAVTAENIVGLIVAVALLGYLVLALIYPERF
jgi:K+-transporting ATPase KdpF subunit